MDDSPWPGDEEQWVIWNGTSGILVMAAMGRVEAAAGGRRAWLARPFDMVGPFSLDELEASGRIVFAACIVMSRQRWQDDQSGLRRDAHEARRSAQQRHHEEFARFNEGWNARPTRGRPIDEKQHRATLNLPIDGTLEPSQVKAAFRRLAQRAHPDVGGSHERFLRITEARNALIERIP